MLLHIARILESKKRPPAQADEDIPGSKAILFLFPAIQNPKPVLSDVEVSKIQN
jgi:hypothetical protein